MKISLILAAAMLLAACSSSKKHSDILFVETGKLIDGVNDTVHSDIDIIVIGGRIAGLGKNLEVPENAILVDLKKFTVLPAPVGAVAHGRNPMEAIKSVTSIAAKDRGLEK